MSSCTDIRATSAFYTHVPKECTATSKLFILETRFTVPVIDFTIAPDGDAWALFDVERAGARASFFPLNLRFTRLLPSEGSDVRHLVSYPHSRSLSLLQPEEANQRPPSCRPPVNRRLNSARRARSAFRAQAAGRLQGIFFAARARRSRARHAHPRLALRGHRLQIRDGRRGAYASRAPPGSSRVLGCARDFSESGWSLKVKSHWSCSLPVTRLLNEILLRVFICFREHPQRA